MQGNLLDLGIELNMVSNDKRVTEIKRYIQTIKERTGCAYSTVPFQQMPSRMCDKMDMCDKMVQASAFWLNMFPPEDGVSNTLSHHKLVVGLTINYNKHCKLEFGSYAQGHKDHNNTTQTRTTGAIALQPTLKADFFSLTTGRQLNQNNWTELLMPQDVINLVHMLTHASNANCNLIFAWHDGTPIKDAEDDKSNADYNSESDSDNTDDGSKDDEYTLAAPNDDDDEYPPDALDLPITGVLEDEDDNLEDQEANRDIYQTTRYEKSTRY
jgi:hypothetical protein